MARILFIDDDPYTLETLEKAVQIFGHHAFLASSGSQGLALALEHCPDLILTDMMLPDMDGIAVVKKLQQNPETASIPVVMLSASPEVDLVALSETAGARAYVNKPVRLQALLELITRFTGG